MLTYACFIEAVTVANQEIYALLQNEGLNGYHHQSFEIGAGGDKSSGIDLEAEKIFLKHLSDFGTIISEESGLFPHQNNNVEIIIDPIDGSDNLLSHLPYYGTSVAYKENGTCKVAIIVNLANGDIFIKDEDRFEKGHLFTTIFSPVTCNDFAKVGIFERSYCSKIVGNALREAGIKYRSPGAFALSLAYAHEVSFVIYEGIMRPYDVEAGFFMCADLHTFYQDDIFLVSKDKETFDKIIEFL